MIRLKLQNFILICIVCVFPALAVANSAACIALFVENDYDGDVFSNTSKVERPQILTPWVKAKNTVVKPKSLPHEEAQALENQVSDLLELNRQIRYGKVQLTSKNVQERSAFYTNVISQFLAHHRITHEVVEFTSLTGAKIFKIRILTSREAALPSALTHLADRVSNLQADLVFSVNYFLTQHGDAAVMPSVDMLGKMYSRFAGLANEVLFPIPKDHALLMLPIYAILHPDYAPYSPSVNHEIHHLETLHKLRQGMSFAFYGFASFRDDFSFLDLIYADPPVIRALNEAYKVMTFDESSAMAKTLLEIKSSLRHRDSEYHKPVTIDDPLVADITYFAGLTKAMNQVSQILSTEAIKTISNFPDTVRFIVKNSQVYASVILVIENKGRAHEVKVEVPLVAARVSQSKAQKLEHFKNQMQLLQIESQRNSVMGDWANQILSSTLKDVQDLQQVHAIAELIVQSLYVETDRNVSDAQYQQKLQERFNEALGRSRR